jgi:hypothetical protein
MDFKLDKTAFTKKTFAEADAGRSYWLNFSLEDRLEAATRLILSVWGYTPENPPRMDKSYFVKKSHNK